MQERTLIKQELISTLIIRIDGSWDSYDFIKLLDSVNRLHNYYAILNHASDQFIRYGKEWNWPTSLTSLPEFQGFTNDLKKRIINLFTSEFTANDHFSYQYEFYLSYTSSLDIAKIKFGSPGNIDFLGLGKAFESIKEVLFHYLPNAETKKNIELKQTEIEFKQQEILTKKIDNLKKMGFNQVDIQKLIGLEYNHVEKLLTLKSQNKIIDIEIIDNQE